MTARSPEERTQLVTYLADRIGTTAKALVGDMPFEMLAVVNGGALKGAVLLINFRRQSIELHCAGAPGWLTRANLRDIFDVVFNRLGCLVARGVTQRKNKKARRLNEKLGFKVVGVLDDEFGLHKDGILYAMRKQDCRWI